MKSLFREIIEEKLGSDVDIETTRWGAMHERMVRKVISEFRKNGRIFIPSKVEPHVYVEASLLPTASVERYALSQLRHLRTQYFNTLKPVQKYLNEAKLLKLMERLDLAFEEAFDE